MIGAQRRGPSRHTTNQRRSTMNKTSIATFIILIALAITSLFPSKTFAQDAFNNQLTIRESQLMLAAHNAIGSGTPPEVETMNVEQIAQQFGVSTEEVYAYRDRFDELMELTLDRTC